jgi:hypothetical protein
LNGHVPKPLWRTAAAFAALAAAAIVAAILLPSSCGIEGAYFDRAIGAPKSVGSIVISRYGVCWVPDVLIGAAAAFAVSAAVLVVIGIRLRRGGPAERPARTTRSA